MFAVSAMSPTVQMLFFAAAVVLFVLTAVGVSSPRVSFLAAGLACFAFPWFWNALAAM